MCTAMMSHLRYIKRGGKNKMQDFMYSIMPFEWFLKPYLHVNINIYYKYKIIHF